MYYHISKISRFTEGEAWFMISQLIVAIKHLHDNGLIFWDLKPENILVDYEGNLRLVDFGLTKNISDDLNESDMTFCGSPEYLSPEMLLCQNWTQMIDIYSLGAVLYEFVIGCPPFYSED